MRKINPRHFAYLFIAAIIAMLILCTIDCSAGPIKRKRMQQKDTVRIDLSAENLQCDEMYNELQLEVISLSNDLTILESEYEQCIMALSQKPVEKETIVINCPEQKLPKKIKIKKSYNDVTKNSNNSTEIIKLRKSLLFKDNIIDSLTLLNIVLSGKLKDSDKEISRMKNSTTGDSSPSINKSGNTTSKAPWYTYLIVFAAGGICSLAIRSLLKNILL